MHAAPSAMPTSASIRPLHRPCSRAEGLDLTSASPTRWPQQEGLQHRLLLEELPPLELLRASLELPLMMTTSTTKEGRKGLGGDMHVDLHGVVS